MKPERISDIALAKMINRPLSLVRKVSAKGGIPWAAEIDKGRFTYRIREIDLWIRQHGPDDVFPRRPPRPGYVYVIEAGEFVKIGFAADVEKRLRALRTACPMPLTVIAEIKGTMVTEQKLHRRFAGHRAEGEWFRREGSVAKWIKEGCPL